jgi:hypothetical protein
LVATPRSPPLPAHPRTGGHGANQRRLSPAMVGLSVDRWRHRECGADRQSHRARVPPRTLSPRAARRRRPRRTAARHTQFLPWRLGRHVRPADAGSIQFLAGEIDADAAIATWEAALASMWDRAPVWVHGDVAPSNLLVVDGELRAVIDFGCAAVGDPASDLVMAWTFFTDESREVFRRELPLDDATWERGRGWAIWKALITLAEERHGGGEPSPRRGGSAGGSALARSSTSYSPITAARGDSSARTDQQRSRQRGGRETALVTPEQA